MAQWVYATGCVTAIGLDSAQTCAAVRARQSGIQALVPQAGDPLLAATVPAASRLKKSPSDWPLHLALRALRECLRPYGGDMARLALFITLPEPFRKHALTRDGNGHAFVSRVVRRLGAKLSPHSRVLLEGHAAAVMALEAAELLLEHDDIDAAVIGGIDSLVNDEDQERLHQSGRRHEPSNPFGVIPGEAAAFIMTGRACGGPFSQPAMASVLGAALAQEADHLRTDRYSLGKGLQQAIRGALQRAGMDESCIQWRVTDINGERYRAWESTALLARQYRAWRDGLPTLHVPAFAGDVGCASLPLQIIVSAHGMQSGWAPGPVAVCESSSEGPLRGACIIGPIDGARLPPFRMLADEPADEAVGVVDRLATRLPHELGWLAHQRGALVLGGLNLNGLLQFDERIDAHIGLLRTMGRRAWQACVHAIEEVGPGALFAPAVIALEAGDAARLQTILAADRSPDTCDSSLVDAFGWASAQALRGLIATMAGSRDGTARLLATAAMHSHRVPPGKLLAPLLQDPVPAVRARALQLAGELGIAASIEQVLASLAHEDLQVRFRAAWAATLLGHGEAAAPELTEMALGPSPHARQALGLLLRTADARQVQRIVEQLARASDRAPALTRRLIESCAAAGDSVALPWLIKQMRRPKFARCAGEAFSVLTGADLNAGGLAAPAPVGLESEPDDDAVLDEDNGLPWPDAEKLAHWWHAQAHRYASGQRYFMGQSPSVENCRRVLRDGTQRRRVVAAQYLCLLLPGTPLFPTAAPAWRQLTAFERWN